MLFVPFRCVLQDYDDARSRRGSETQLHRSDYDQESVSEILMIYIKYGNTMNIRNDL